MSRSTEETIAKVADQVRALGITLDDRFRMGHRLESVSPDDKLMRPLDDRLQKRGLLDDDALGLRPTSALRQQPAAVSIASLSPTSSSSQPQFSPHPTAVGQQFSPTSSWQSQLSPQPQPSPRAPPQPQSQPHLQPHAADQAAGQADEQKSCRVRLDFGARLLPSPPAAADRPVLESPIGSTYKEPDDERGSVPEAGKALSPVLNLIPARADTVADSLTELLAAMEEHTARAAGRYLDLAKRPTSKVVKIPVAMVGSTNPGKIAATQAALNEWPSLQSSPYANSYIVRGMATESGVREQPLGLEETVLGAKNRARAAREDSGAHIGIGLESGLVEVENSTVDFCACVIYDGDRYHVGLSSGWPLPPRVAATIPFLGYNQSFENVGVSADATGDGVLSALSGGVLSRPIQMQEAVRAALVSAQNEALFAHVPAAVQSPCARARRQAPAEEAAPAEEVTLLPPGAVTVAVTPPVAPVTVEEVSIYVLNYLRLLSVVFFMLAIGMLLIPDKNLASDGLRFNDFTVAGRAELRSYYSGTALAVSHALRTSPPRLGLQTALCVLGGFASARAYGYAIDGVDQHSGFRLHQHAVFFAELLGTSGAAFGLLSLEQAQAKLFMDGIGLGQGAQSNVLGLLAGLGPKVKTS